MDWEGSEDSHSFGQKVPPLYIEIRDVLQEYPDGQIFKVQAVLTIKSINHKSIILCHVTLRYVYS